MSPNFDALNEILTNLFKSAGTTLSTSAREDYQKIALDVKNHQTGSHDLYSQTTLSFLVPYEDIIQVIRDKSEDAEAPILSGNREIARPWITTEVRILYLKKGF